MLLLPSSQHEVAIRIANFIRTNTIGYGAAACHANAPWYPEPATVIITKNGRSDRLAEVSIHADRLVYASRTGTHISYPIHHEDAGRIIAAFLTIEND